MDNRHIYLIVTCTLAGVMISVILVLLAGFFSPAVDNKEIFAVLGPAFQTIVGCFVGILGSRVMSDKKGGSE